MNKAVADSRSQTLDTILTNTSCLWKGRRNNLAQAAIASGHARLDRHLPGGGWPRGAVTELMTANPGVGELSLLFPALAGAGQQGRWIVFIDPPWVPYPAALHGHGLCLERLLLIRSNRQEESLWACEQALRDIPEGIVLAWPEKIRFARLRRLQLAAQSQGAMAFMFRPEACAAESSPAALRLKLNYTPDGMCVEILKCRGPRPTGPLLLRPPQHGQRMINERAFMAGDTTASPGAGLSYPRPRRSSRSCRHH